MTDAEMDDLYELYLLGVLEPDVAAEVERYFQEHPAEYAERLGGAYRLVAAMAGIAEPVKAPAQLRDRVLATIAPQRVRLQPRRLWGGWVFAAAALSSACLALALFSLRDRGELGQMRDQLNSAISERNQLRSTLTNAINSELAQVAALTAERDRLRVALTNANSTAQSQLAALTNERDQLRAALANANSAAQTQSAAFTSERDQLRVALENANSTSRAEVAALTSERDQLRAVVSTARTDIAALTGERNQLRAALSKASNTAVSQESSLTGELDELRSALMIMRNPETRSKRFGSPTAPHGWVFANREGGLVFLGSRLPSVASDRTFELWLVPKTGTPESAGVFRPNDSTGDAIHISSLAVDPSRIKAVAVSEEPRSGSTAPTTKPFLLVPLG